jgi:hypothetical protein
MLMLLLIATSVLGFSSSSSSSSTSSYLTPYAAASPISMNATTTATTTTTTPITSTIKLGEEPFALGRYTPVSQTLIDETLLQQQQLKLVFEGSTTITLPKQCLIERVKGEHFGPEQFLL